MKTDSCSVIQLNLLWLTRMSANSRWAAANGSSSNSDGVGGDNSRVARWSSRTTSGNRSGYRNNSTNRSVNWRVQDPSMQTQSKYNKQEHDVSRQQRPYQRQTERSGILQDLLTRTSRMQSCWKSLFICRYPRPFPSNEVAKYIRFYWRDAKKSKELVGRTWQFETWQCARGTSHQPYDRQRGQCFVNRGGAACNVAEYNQQGNWSAFVEVISRE